MEGWTLLGRSLMAVAIKLGGPFPGCPCNTGPAVLGVDFAKLPYSGG